MQKKSQFLPLGFCTGKISKDHCIACCASTDSTTVSIFQTKITKLRGDIRGWAKQEVKRQLTEIAQSIQENDEFSPVGFYQGSPAKWYPCRTYKDIVDWWKHCKGTEKDYATYNEIVYGWWKKKARWELEWEKKFMERYAWTYDPTSVQKAKESAKGCVARNIVMGRVDLIHQLQKVSTDHNKKILKKRTDGSSINENGKYKRSKPNEYIAKEMIIIPKQTNKVSCLANVMYYV
jgi:hypothetical protein